MLLSYDALMERRSIRKYTDKEIELDTIHHILRAGMYAPSAKNSKPWEFIVVREKSTLKQMSDIGQFWKMLPQAGAAIITLADLSVYKSDVVDFFVQDCAAATQNMLIAAHGEGLGAVWLGLYPKEPLIKGIRELLGIPEAIVPFSVISMGYSQSYPHPHTSYDQEKVHFETY